MDVYADTASSERVLADDSSTHDSNSYMLRRASMGAYGGFGEGYLGAAGGIPMSVGYSGMPYQTGRLAGYGLGGLGYGALSGGYGAGYGSYGGFGGLGGGMMSGYGGYGAGMMPGYGYGMTAGYPGDLMTSSYMARGGSYMAPMY
jgi:hypothetical protein